MDNTTRLHYLEVMGIDIWIPRQVSVAGLSATDNAVEGLATAGRISQIKDYHDLAQDQVEISKSKLGRSFDDGTLHLSMVMPNNEIDEQSWNALSHAVSDCHACSLCETRTQTVFGVGNLRPTWMLIGEAPGQNEDLQGEPFVGKAGQLLNEMLRAIGLQRADVFITNVLKCRPPQNRDPQAEEVSACHGFLQRQIELLQPKIILAVGRIAAQNLLATTMPLAKLRGRQHALNSIPLVVVHHPAYLLRALSEKAKAWDDLQFALSICQSLKE